MDCTAIQSSMLVPGDKVEGWSLVDKGFMPARVQLQFSRTWGWRSSSTLQLVDLIIATWKIAFCGNHVCCGLIVLWMSFNKERGNFLLPFSSTARLGIVLRCGHIRPKRLAQ